MKSPVEGPDAPGAASEDQTTALLSMCRRLVEPFFDSKSRQLSGKIPVMSFYFENIRPVIGTPFTETPDSVVILMPAFLKSDGVTITGEPMVREGIVRVFKSALTHSVTASPVHRFYYLNYLVEAKDRCPEFMDERTLEKVTAEIKRLKGRGLTSSLDDLAKLDPDFSGKYINAQKETFEATSAALASAAAGPEEDGFAGPLLTGRKNLLKH